MGYYLCKVVFSSGEQTKSGKTKTTKSQILVEAESVTEAEKRLHAHLGDDLSTAHLDFEVTAVSQSQIESVLQIKS